MMRKVDVGNRGLMLLRDGYYHYSVLNRQTKQLMTIYSIPALNRNVYLTKKGMYFFTKNSILSFYQVGRSEHIPIYSLNGIDIENTFILYAGGDVIIVSTGKSIILFKLDADSKKVNDIKVVRFSLPNQLSAIHPSVSIGVRKDVLKNGEEILSFFSPLGGFPFFIYKDDRLSSIKKIVFDRDLLISTGQSIMLIRVNPLVIEALFLSIISKNIDDSPSLYEFVLSNKDKLWYYLDVYDYIGESVAKNQFETIESFLIKNYRESIFTLISASDYLSFNEEIKGIDILKDKVVLAFDDEIQLYNINVYGKLNKLKRYRSDDTIEDCLLIDENICLVKNTEDKIYKINLD